MRRFVIGSGIGFIILGVILAACGGPSTDSGAGQNQQRLADKYEIDQIEKKFHHATTTKDIGLMMSLYAPNATMTIGPGATASGVDEIRQFWLTKAATFEPENHWVSDHPAYKLEITVNGDRGTLHFECHYVDIDTGQVISTTTADFDVARLDGAWLITNMVGGTTVLGV